MKVAQNILQLVGNTPMLQLSAYSAKESLNASIFAKLESFNPGGSIKDRTAMAMIDRAERDGLLKPGGTVIEPTSGNTGIGLAVVAAARGYHLILTMPDTMSVERRRIVEALGAKVVLTPGSLGMKGAIEKARQLASESQGAYIPGQFVNPANSEAHFMTTGPEIWQQMNGKIDCLVAGVGTGGTISGVGKFLKQCNPSIEIVAVEPVESAVLSGEKPGSHRLQGIGAGFIPEIYRPEYVDRIVKVATPDAIDAARLLASTEGVLAGFSSGAALFAATGIARRESMAGKNIVVILPDTGERYLSTDLFE